MSTRFTHLIAATAVTATLLGACRPDTTPVSLPAVPPSATESALSLRAVSTRPWLVTGGDLLVEVQVRGGYAPAAVRITLNGEDVSAAFQAGPNPDTLLGRVEGLRDGDSLLRATLANRSDSAELRITHYPVTGPVISGPHEQPFLCETQTFRGVGGIDLGAPLDPHCSAATRIDHVYWSEASGDFQPWSPAVSEPIPRVTLSNGSDVPFIVRVETGTVNRAIYEIAMLHDPRDTAPSPWRRPPGWNGKLVYTHGGGCRGGWYRQGNVTGGVLRKGLLEMGYALTSSSLNVFGQNCNDLLASETHLLVKERFIEQYGEPVYTIATGASGGSYQSHQTADNYPGVFDGLIVSSSFPDVTSATIFTLADARLLHHYFTQTAPDLFSPAEQQAVTGFGSLGSLANLAQGAARLDPVFEADAPPEAQGGEVGLPALESQRYGPGRPEGIRATVYDHTVNVYGRADDAPVAARPLDNVGVQYGLQALNEGRITTAQFLALNRDIGGFDRDFDWVPRRHRADPAATRAAFETGRILSGGQGLASTPIIDYRTYTDHVPGGDIHMIVHQFSTRERLYKANGHADNHVMQVGGRWGFTPDAPDLGTLFQAMDRWLMAIRGDTTTADPAYRVVRNRPADLQDQCWDTRGPAPVAVVQELGAHNPGLCGELYPVYLTPRHVAGAPLANDVVSCHLRPVSLDDYRVSFTDEELRTLYQVFPEGVCDWSLPDRHGAVHQGPWQSLGPSPVNLR